MDPNSSTLHRLRRKLVGDRAFYKMVLIIVIPIIVQNAISNFVNLLDNIMVGRIGTDEMTGVSIVNQLMFIVNLCIFGGVSGAGIFAAQYHGAGNHTGVRHCFRFKIYLCLLLTVAAMLIFGFFQTPLIMLYLNENNDAARIASTLRYGEEYLRVMLWGIAPFALSQAYASTLRETGETSLPMRAGIIAVLVNLVFNYLLIYGSFGFPALGVRGAAIATVLSRYVELAIVVIATHSQPERHPFAVGAYRSFRIPLPLVKQIVVKGMPLLINETLWSLGVAMIARCYSMRGLDIVTAQNISGTVSNLFNVVYLSMGSATAILLGQELGSGDTELAKDHAWKLIAFSLASCIVMSVLLCICSPFIPMIYNTEDHIRHLATQLLIIGAVCMPLLSFANSCYFTLRSGGKTALTFVFDSGFSWVISMPVAYLLVRFTALPVVTVYLLVQLCDFIKCVLGFILVKKGIWINNMVSE